MKTTLKPCTAYVGDGHYCGRNDGNVIQPTEGPRCRQHVTVKDRQRGTESYEQGYDACLEDMAAVMEKEADALRLRWGGVADVYRALLMRDFAKEMLRGRKIGTPHT